RVLFRSQNWKLRGADEPARGVRAHQKEIWVYRFDWDEERSLFGYDLPGLLGAGHAMEIPFVFGWLSLGPATRLVFDPDNADTDRALSDAMMSYWTQFAYSGDPGRGRSGEAVAWPAWSNAEGGPKMLVLDTTNDGGIRPSPESVTFEGIVANSRLDPRLAKRRDWCEMMLFLTGGGPEFDAAEYARSTGEDCSEYPVEGFPWES
ncbi:MAG: carboxylesterase family protein, partial [Myxococcota bacterium]